MGGIFVKKTNAARRSAALNIVMVLAAVLILAAGVLTLGSLEGWFDKPQPAAAAAVTATPGPVLPMAEPEPATAVVTAVEKSGTVNLVRGGAAYTFDEGTQLLDGDVLETLNAASAVLDCEAGRLTLDENSRVQINIDEAGIFMPALDSGGLFAAVDAPFAMQLGGETLTLDSGVFAASAPYGSAMVYMLENEAELGGKTLRAGHKAGVVAGVVTLGELDENALNAFELAAARTAAETHTLCFTVKQLDAVGTEREKARQEAQKAELLDAEEAEAVERERQENEERVRAARTAQGQSADSGTLDYEDIVVEQKTCTIEIRCDTILDNMDELAEGKNAYVPSNGCILAASRIGFDEGETVFDVLRRACSLAGVHLEFAWTPGYDSYYIEGIGNLYEFDCGSQSGWMYKVNGWFPNYGCSSYKLSDGDSIVFCYTCKGYGADVGGGM